jgi:hypothetical protein
MLVRVIQAAALIIMESFQTMIAERRWGLLPAFAVFLLLSVLLILVKAVSPIAPFVYSLF